MKIVIIAFIILCAISIPIIVRKTKNKRDYISFMETFNLTDIPIVTFYAGDKKLNFMVDTGASLSHITEDVSRILTGTESYCGMSLTSINGTDTYKCKVIETAITYNGKEYIVKLHVNHGLDKSFKDLKTSKGVTLHGILGVDFLEKYSYIIDFKKYIVYSKK